MLLLIDALFCQNGLSLKSYTAEPPLLLPPVSELIQQALEKIQQGRNPLNKTNPDEVTRCAWHNLSLALVSFLVLLRLSKA